jgi:hypothetical protein
VAIVFYVVLWVWSAATTPPTQTLDDVVDRAARYASEYEQQLTAIIAEEDYEQTSNVDRYRPDGRTYVETRKRSLHSDFLITNSGNRLIAIRNVRQVDGMPIDSAHSLDKGPLDGIQRLKSESARFNIGIQRNFHLPTFAMEVLHESNRARFRFERIGEADVDGMRVWEVGFQQTTGPPLIHDLSNGNEFLSSGTLWIEPETGRILQTEIHSDGISAGGLRTASTSVEYRDNGELGFLVPVRMDERYGQTHITLECHAEYRNFRRIEVDVTLNADTPDASSAADPHPPPLTSSQKSITEAASSDPLDVLLLFDRSALQQDTGSVMQRAVRSFLQSFDARNRVAVGRFDSSIEMIGWWTDSREKITTALRQVPDPAVAQTSSLYAVMSRGLRSELLPIRGRRRVLVVLTAGRDDELFTSAWRSGHLPEKPSASFQTVLDEAASEGIPIQIVAFNTDQNYQSSRNPDEVVNILNRYFPGSTLKTDFLNQARMNLESISNASGGKIYFPRKLGDIALLYNAIARFLSSFH